MWSHRSASNAMRLGWLIGAVGLLFGQSAHAVLYPPDAGVVDITRPPYNAVGDGVFDNTAIFQQAIRDTVDRSRVLYVPDGIYLCRDRLNWGSGAGFGFPFGHRLILQGQSEAGTIIRLAPNSPGFEGAAGSSKVFLDIYEGNTANAFDNYVKDLTIEIGAGNPGAVGVEYQSNNTGAIRNLTIRSLDPAGAGRTGLNIAFEFPGPFLVKNLTVEGFESGIVGAPQEYSATFENLTVRNQTVQGIYTWRLPLQIRNLISENSVPVIVSDSNPGAWGHVVIDGGVFTGGSLLNDAIVNRNGAGVVALRGVETEGYRFAVNDLHAGGATVPDGPVAFYASDAALGTGFSSPPGFLDLGAEDLDPPVDPLSQWVSPLAFGAVPNDGEDDTAAIQAAFNAGFSTVYFPNGGYLTREQIVVPPTVKRIVGLNSSMNAIAGLWMESEKGVFRIVGETTEPLFVEHLHVFDVGYAAIVDHASTRPLIWRDGEFTRYRNSVGGGTVYLENVVTDDVLFRGQRVFARQLNPEGGITKIRTIGSDLYILGLKTEGNGTVVEARGGARTLVLGGLIYPATEVTQTLAMFDSVDSATSFSLPESCYIFNGWYNIWLRETRGGVTRELLRSALTRGHSNCGLAVSLANGYAVDNTEPEPPSNLRSPASTLNSVTLAWDAAADTDGVIARYNVYRNGVFIGATTETTFVDRDRPDGTSFIYAVSAVNGGGLEGAASNDPEFSTRTDDVPPRVTAVRNGFATNALTVEFSEPVQAASAQNPANYTISPSGSVLTATLAPDGRTVALTTAPLIVGSPYVLSVAGVLDRATAPNTLIPSSRGFTIPASGTGTGLRGEYYDTIDLSGPALTQIDPVINFDYGLGSPRPEIAPDSFSIRWTGRIQPIHSETYTITARSDDGVRVYIDGVEVVMSWRDQAPTDSSGTIGFESGRLYDIEVEYFENSGGASMQLFWESPSTPRQIIPTSQLYPDRLLTIVRTTDGRGADTTLNRGGTGDVGADGTLGVYNDPSSTYSHAVALTRFDLAGIDRRRFRVADARINLTLSGFGNGDGRREVNVIGLRDERAADNWIETGPGHITWFPSPLGESGGSDVGGANARPENGQFVGEIFINNAGFRLNFRKDALTTRTAALADFINADTDNLVSFVLKRATRSNEGQGMLSKEAGVQWAPALKLRLERRNDRGDTNCDGLVDFNDIACFVAALISEESWAGCGGESGCDYVRVSDTNADNRVDFDDIESFVACLVAGRCP